MTVCGETRGGCRQERGNCPCSSANTSGKLFPAGTATKRAVLGLSLQDIVSHRESGASRTPRPGLHPPSFVPAMKTKSRLLLASLSGVLAALAAASAENQPTASSPATSPATAASAQISAPTPAGPAPAITETEALKKAAVSQPNYPAHPSTNSPRPSQSSDEPLVHTGASTFGSNTDPNIISTPPPPSRPENRPPAPAGVYVWVPGHFAPVKGEWQWVPGEWSVPATPSSVWIEGRYDEKAKRYSPGYWQPDRPPAPQTNGDGVVKESPVTAPGGY